MSSTVNGLTGSFAEHIINKEGLQMKIPDNLAFEDAATLGGGVATVGQSLYQSLGLPLPPAKVQGPTSILIYGASTATGTLAMQFAKLSGLEVVATASPHNFDLLRKLGADRLFDYRSPNVGAHIREATEDRLALALDCIAEGSSPKICAEAIGSAGGKYSSLRSGEKLPRDDVTSVSSSAFTALGELLELGTMQLPAKPQDYEFAVGFFKLAEGLLNDGMLKPHPSRVLPGGLEGIPDGLKQLKEGKVSGVKLVYRIE